MIQAKVKCPRCHRILIANEGESEVDCNCHTYCEDGAKPGDCNLTPYTLNHEASPPFGLHTGGAGHDDDPMHIQYWCSVHSRYGYKTPISVPVDWNVWRGRRAPKRFRMVNNV